MDLPRRNAREIQHLTQLVYKALDRTKEDVPIPDPDDDISYELIVKWVRAMWDNGFGFNDLALLKIERLYSRFLNRFSQTLSNVLSKLVPLARPIRSSPDSRVDLWSIPLGEFTITPRNYHAVEHIKDTGNFRKDDYGIDIFNIGVTPITYNDTTFKLTSRYDHDNMFQYFDLDVTTSSGTNRLQAVSISAQPYELSLLEPVPIMCTYIMKSDGSITATFYGYEFSYLTYDFKMKKLFSVQASNVFRTTTFRYLGHYVDPMDYITYKYACVALPRLATEEKVGLYRFEQEHNSSLGLGLVSKVTNLLTSTIIQKTFSFENPSVVNSTKKAFISIPQGTKKLQFGFRPFYWIPPYVKRPTLPNEDGTSWHTSTTNDWSSENQPEVVNKGYFAVDAANYAPQEMYTDLSMIYDSRQFLYRALDGTKHATVSINLVGEDGSVSSTTGVIQFAWYLTEAQLEQISREFTSVTNTKLSGVGSDKKTDVPIAKDRAFVRPKIHNAPAYNALDGTEFAKPLSYTDILVPIPLNQVTDWSKLFYLHTETTHRAGIDNTFDVYCRVYVNPGTLSNLISNVEGELTVTAKVYTDGAYRDVSSQIKLVPSDINYENSKENCLMSQWTKLGTCDIKTTRVFRTKGGSLWSAGMYKVFVDKIAENKEEVTATVSNFIKGMQGLTVQDFKTVTVDTGDSGKVDIEMKWHVKEGWYNEKNLTDVVIKNSDGWTYVPTYSASMAPASGCPTILDDYLLAGGIPIWTDDKNSPLYNGSYDFTLGGNTIPDIYSYTAKQYYLNHVLNNKDALKDEGTQFRIFNINDDIDYKVPIWTRRTRVNVFTSDDRVDAQTVVTKSFVNRYSELNNTFYTSKIPMACIQSSLNFDAYIPIENPELEIIAPYGTENIIDVKLNGQSIVAQPGSGDSAKLGKKITTYMAKSGEFCNYSLDMDIKELKLGGKITFQSETHPAGTLVIGEITGQEQWVREMTTAFQLIQELDYRVSKLADVMKLVIAEIAKIENQLIIQMKLIRNIVDGLTKKNETAIAFEIVSILGGLLTPFCPPLGMAMSAIGLGGGAILSLTSGNIEGGLMQFMEMSMLVASGLPHPESALNREIAEDATLQDLSDMESLLSDRTISTILEETGVPGSSVCTNEAVDDLLSSDDLETYSDDSVLSPLINHLNDKAKQASSCTSTTNFIGIKNIVDKAKGNFKVHADKEISSVAYERLKEIDDDDLSDGAGIFRWHAEGGVDIEFNDGSSEVSTDEPFSYENIYVNGIGAYKEFELDKSVRSRIAERANYLNKIHNIEKPQQGTMPLFFKLEPLLNKPNVQDPKYGTYAFCIYHPLVYSKYYSLFTKGRQTANNTMRALDVLAFGLSSAE